MSVPMLFQPLTLRGVTFPNRAWVSPMCMYSAEGRDGMPTDFHLVHLGALAQGGFGLIISEATAVSPEGRISPQDLGLWTDEQTDAWRRLVEVVHGQGGLLGVQLAHAGRKAGRRREFPGEPGGAATPDEGGWTPVGPSAALPFPGFEAPEELDAAGLDKVVDDFAAAAVRAKDAGLDVIEIHAAHGYLMHEFLSPLSNQRTDEYGGSFENRSRLVLRVVDAVRAAWDGPLFVRISSTEWTEGGFDIDEAVQLAEAFKERGVDLVDVSTGGNVVAPIPVGPGYQVPFSERIRAEVSIPTATVGMITDGPQAEEILEDGRADAILIGRAALREPHWPQRAAYELGLSVDEAPYRPQHIRGAWR